jgi:hypothetical protein
MFEPEEDSMVLEIVRGFFGLEMDQMMSIGDKAKDILFCKEALSEDAAIQRIKTGLSEMSKEESFIAGIFVSGLLRCHLTSQAERCAQEMVEEGNKSE